MSDDIDTSIEDSGGPIPLDYFHVGLAAFLLSLNALLSLVLQLGLEKRLLISALRAFVQLSVLGYILVPIFKADSPIFVVLYAFFMTMVATYEAQKRSAYTYKGMWWHVWVSLAGTGSLVLSYTLIIVISVKPWWEAQYLIPIFGMILGNSTNGISVGLVTTLAELSEGRHQVEGLLALGATRWEACAPLLCKAITLGLTPILNQMSIIGMVSIPGMMTGQILGGSSPELAARYQCIIIFVIGAATAVGTVSASVMGVLSVVDSEHRVRPERLVKRDKGSSLLSPLASHPTFIATVETLKEFCCSIRLPGFTKLTPDTFAG
eukprot:CAMPEP_0196592054 /NCGR_PEP_ID=MMETSP1081-20130531/71712_1 /TAXON_ID=36882 /ORGANISM="Pyramimonas amylifera, Strain CCMP720" /LENGTH=320 /DNA_ID=CAMNT_0041915625 /DNA_START=55 /DNA_END=1017 /DNA_ORIENTATION=-